jgi:hypothetical protein
METARNQLANEIAYQVHCGRYYLAEEYADRWRFANDWENLIDEASALPGKTGEFWRTGVSTATPRDWRWKVYVCGSLYDEGRCRSLACAVKHAIARRGPALESNLVLHTGVKHRRRYVVLGTHDMQTTMDALAFQMSAY